jgi:hypothetical protein
MTASAQQVTLVTPSSMQFSDPAYGVTFRYPTSWTFSVNHTFYSPVSITSPDHPAFGIVFFTPYPKTNLSGAEFVYTNYKAASAKECSPLTVENGDTSKTLAPKTINSIEYEHATAENAGMCHQVQEDMYAAYRNQTCYLFDLAIHTVCAGVIDGTRTVTSSEIAQVQASLEKVLSSVEIKDLKKD